jgi:hypothetical protein
LGQIEDGLVGGACNDVVQENQTPLAAGMLKFEDLPMKFQNPVECAKLLGSSNHKPSPGFKFVATGEPIIKFSIVNLLSSFTSNQNP